MQNHISVHSRVTAFAHSFQYITGSNLGFYKSQDDCVSQRCVVLSQQALLREQLRKRPPRPGAALGMAQSGRNKDTSAGGEFLYIHLRI